MIRPFKVILGKWVGVLAILSSLALVYLYLPGNASALNTIEWSIVGGWLFVGLLFFILANRIYGRAGMRDKMNAHLD